MIQSLYTGLSGLQTYQKALDVTSNNISNFNTEGYTRQETHFSTNPTKQDNNISMGTGSHIQSVTRIEDSFLYNQLNDAKSNYSKFNEQNKIFSKVDDSLREGSFSKMYDSFFESLHRYADNPHNLQTQFIVKEQGENLNKRSEEILDIFNSNIISSNNYLKELSKELHNMNKQSTFLETEIKKIEAGNDNNIDKIYANSLRDQLDLVNTKIETHKAKIESIDESIDMLSSISNDFNNKFSNTYNNINTYLSSDMNYNDTNDMIESEGKIREEYNNMIVSVSSITNTSDTMLGSSEAVMKELQKKDDSISNVDLDKEIVDKIRFQRAYEANAVVIRTSDELLKTVINLKQ